ncbi:MAG: transposase [Aeromonadales bacterium]|nr:transposase [Aeromonadales bacterium]
MTVLCSITPAMANSGSLLGRLHKATSIEEALGSRHLDRLARETRALRREREFSYSDFLICGVAAAADAPQECAWTMKSVSDCCNMKEGKKGFAPVSDKCVRQRLNNPRATRFFQAASAELLALVSKDAGRKLKAAMKGTPLAEMMRMLGVDDIVLYDGTEVSLRPGCINNFDCKGKGPVQRGRGEVSNSAVKVHVAYSLLRRCYVSLDITSAVHSERECVHFSDFRNTLFIMDRGYSSLELEHAIEASGNHYLVRGKINSAGTILKASAPGGTARPELEGLKVSSLKGDEDLILDVRQRDGSAGRAMITANPCPEEDSDGFSYLRTSLKCAFLTPFKLYNLYRTRWQIELFNKANKEGSGLVSINSDNKHIIISFLLMGIMASLIKSFVITRAEASGLAGPGSISMLLANKGREICETFKKNLMRLLEGRTTKFQVFKDLCR